MIVIVIVIVIVILCLVYVWSRMQQPVRLEHPGVGYGGAWAA